MKCQICTLRSVTCSVVDAYGQEYYCCDECGDAILEAKKKLSFLHEEKQEEGE